MSFRSVIALAIAIAPFMVDAAVPLYGQCGGSGYTGETECVSGTICVYSNEWYSQCLAGAAASSSTKASSTSTKTSTTSTKTSTTSTKTSTTSTKASTTSTKASTTSTKTSSTKTSSTKTSSTKTSSTKTSTKTSTPAGPVPSGVVTQIPASAGYSALALPQTVTGTFDGGMVKFDRLGSPGECQGQSETGETEAVFILEAGATIKNLIIGKDQAEGIHCRGACRIENVWWEDVCEDAATFKQTGAGDISYVVGGGAFSAQDKIFQHNGAGTVSISNFYANTFGKLYRSCGNCSTSYERHVILNNIALIGGSSGVGINTNFGDTAVITNVCTSGKPTAANVCCRYNGTTPGNEPSKTGCGPDSACSNYTVTSC